MHPSRKAQRILARVLSAAGRVVVCAENVDEAVARAAAAPPELVIAEAPLLAGEAGARFLQGAALGGAASCIALVGTGGAPIEIPRVFATHAVSNLIASEMPVLAEELVVTVLKLLRRDIFGMDKYLSWGANTTEVVLDQASDRRDAVARLRVDVRARGLGGRLATLAAHTADELLSNAIFHAPVDAAGVHVRSSRSRLDDFPLAGRDRVTLRYGCDGRYFCLSVEDGYGSLDRETIVAALAQHAEATLRPREAGPGAGMGLSLVYRYVNHLAFNLQPGVRTEMIALFDVRRIMPTSVRSPTFNIFTATAQGPR